MPNYTKPYGDFVNNVDIADATKINGQINQLYNAVNGGLDGVVNVPGLGDMTTVTTTSKNAAGAINELQALPVFSMSRQALINGNFDVWQRGTSFTNPASGTFSSDRYLVTYNADGGTLPTSITSSQLTLTAGDVKGSYYGCRINVNGAGSGYGVNSSYSLNQKIENGTRYLCGAGKKVTVSFWAKSDIVGKRIGVDLVQRYGSGGSPTANETVLGTIFTLTSTWTKYSYTFTTNTLAGKTFGTNNDDALQLQLFYLWGTTTATNGFGGGTAETFVGSGNIDIAQVQVNAGDQALLFQPRSFAEELALCQRYYEKSYGYAIAPATALSLPGIHTFFVGSSVPNNTAFGKVKFCVKKRVTPTVTIYPYTTPTNTSRVSDTSGPDLGSSSGAPGLIGDDGFTVSNATGGALAVASSSIMFHWASDSEL